MAEFKKVTNILNFIKRVISDADLAAMNRKVYGTILTVAFRVHL
jgi:hypothetical protein